MNQEIKLNSSLSLDRLGSSEQFLLTRRVILSGEVDEGNMRQVTEEMSILNYLEPKKEITVLIDSYGGEVYSGLFMVDFIGSLSCDVSTIVIGKAMSAAFTIAIAGTKKKRYITPYATMMQHQISAAAIGKLSEIETEADECKRLEKLWDSLIKTKTKCTSKLIEKFKIKDVYFSAEKALEHGIVDKIITTI